MINKKNRWLVTFSDLITLLVTFFTLILSMSSMDRMVLKESFKFFTSAPGIMEGTKSIMRELVNLKPIYNLSKFDLNSIVKLIEELNLTPVQGVKLYLLKKNFKNYLIKVNIVNNSDVYVLIDASKIYYPDSYQLTNDGYKFAEKVFNTLKLYSDKCIIEEHTSKFPVETDVIKNNVDLSIKRGVKLIEFLVKKNIDYNRLELIGWGSLKISKDEIVIKFINYLKIRKGEIKNG